MLLAGAEELWRDFCNAGDAYRGDGKCCPSGAHCDAGKCVWPNNLTDDFCKGRSETKWACAVHKGQGGCCGCQHVEPCYDVCINRDMRGLRRPVSFIALDFFGDSVVLI